LPGKGGADGKESKLVIKVFPYKVSSLGEVVTGRSREGGKNKLLLSTQKEDKIEG